MKWKQMLNLHTNWNKSKREYFTMEMEERALRSEEEKWIVKLKGCFQHLMQVSENVKAYE